MSFYLEHSQGLVIFNGKKHFSFSNIITKTRVTQIHRWLERNGNFNNFEEILNLKGFDVKSIEKFCDFILTDGNKNGTN